MIPDDLYTEVKVSAAREGITITSFIERSLRAALEQRISRGDVRLPVLPQATGARPGVGLRDNAAVRELLEAGQ